MLSHTVCFAHIGSTQRRSRTRMAKYINNVSVYIMDPCRHVRIHIYTHTATPAGPQGGPQCCHTWIDSITLSMSHSEHTWLWFICTNRIFILCQSNTVAMKTFSHLVNYEWSLHLRDVPLVHMCSVKAWRNEEIERNRSCCL